MEHSSMTVQDAPRSFAPESPAERVVDAVAAETDADPLDLPPLYDALDPDALNDLVDRMGSGTVRFRYAGSTVTVHGDGTVELDADY